jgi:hypothetical protein
VVGGDPEFRPQNDKKKKLITIQADLAVQFLNDMLRGELKVTNT